jgi:hypothetical protein
MKLIIILHTQNKNQYERNLKKNIYNISPDLYKLNKNIKLEKILSSFESTCTCMQFVAPFIMLSRKSLTLTA